MPTVSDELLKITRHKHYFEIGFAFYLCSYNIAALKITLYTLNIFSMLHTQESQKNCQSIAYICASFK